MRGVAPVLVSPTKKTFTLDKFAYIDEFIPVHMIEQIQGPIVNSRAKRRCGRSCRAAEHRDTYRAACQYRCYSEPDPHYGCDRRLGQCGSPGQRCRGI